MMKLDIIIPVYNEDENIVQLLKTLEHFKNTNVINKEILLIKNPKQGPNSAIIEGIRLSNAEIILIYMADDFENIKLINGMINLIVQGNNLVIPSRFISGGKMIGNKKMKKMLTTFGAYLMYYLARIPFKDCTNAFKMFSKKLKEKIKFDSTKGFTFALELTTKTYLLNLKIIEIPSIWIEDKNRKSNFKLFKWFPYYIYWLIYSLIKIFFKDKNN